ncbi:hypothetical protein KAR91_23770 [Candidatus Pacearchaeota archaeon]|nr:hypothetical protein [Candidatus Pacearchaeota archaeon]
MKIEDKVCSLEQAKRLVELGVVLETERWWWSEKLTNSNEVIDWMSQWNCGCRNIHQFPAPDVAELMQIVPKGTELQKLYEAYSVILNIGALVGLTDFGKKFADEQAAESLVDVLIWLIENKHIKPEDLKL